MVMPSPAKNTSLYSACIIKGISLIIIQTLFIRELLVVFSGNELTIAIILATWIALEAIASGLISRIKINNPFISYVLSQIAISLILPFNILFIRNIKNILHIMPQEAVGIGHIFIISFFALVPVCLLDGFMFPLIGRLISNTAKGISKVYILEALGVMAGANIFTYILLPHIDSFRISIMVSSLILLSSLSISLSWLSPNRLKRVLLVTVLSIVILIIVSNASGLLNLIGDLSIKEQFKDFKVIENKNSIYSNIIVGEREGQLTFFLNGSPSSVFPSQNTGFAQEITHLPLLSHRGAKNILLIGDASPVLSELLKYSPGQIEYVAIDFKLIGLIRKYSPLNLFKERINTIIQDPRRYIKSTKNKFDIILINLPEPSSIFTNRFFTKEFFKETHGILNNGGIITFHLPGTLSYYSDELKKINVNILNTLKSVFNNTAVIPGDSNIFLASSETINLDYDYMALRLEETKINASLITKDYLKYRLEPHYFKWFNSSIKNTSTGINSDLRPAALFHTLALWNSKFYPHSKNSYKLLEKINIFAVLSIVLIILFILFYRIHNKRNFSLVIAISTTGFFAMAFNIILIIMYQGYFGYIFGRLALLSGFFMAGLGIGAIVSLKKMYFLGRDLKNLIIIESILILTGLLLIISVNLNFFMNEYIFYLFSFLTAVIIGFEFPIVNELYLNKYRQGNLGFIYSLDLVGSFLGAIISGIILIPLYGVITTSIFLMATKIISILFLSINRIYNPS